MTTAAAAAATAALPRADATPMFHLVEEIAQISAEHFLAAFPERLSTFVLDGGAFAFMGAEPVATLRVSVARSRQITIDEADGTHIVIDDADPFDALRALLRTHTPPMRGPDAHAAPFPFCAGAVGYVGYECGQMLERLPCIERPRVDMPDMAFAIHRWVIAVCRETRKTWLSVLADDRDNALATRDRVLGKLACVRSTQIPIPIPIPIPIANTSLFTIPNAISAGLSRDEYLARIAVAKDHIRAGDAFEICLTNALHTPFARDDARQLFHELAKSNPAPFAAMLDLPEAAIISSSPERFLSFDANTRAAESRPIKGTRARSSNAEEDERLADDLATSEKDRAENAMIVDLVRNDLGKVCRFGSVEAPELFAVERYATVHQLVSTVRGVLEDDRDAFDLIRACFPPGSMTGAPKIEAMTILEHLEPVERGVYSGALGWIDHNGSLDLSVVIRTVVIDNHGTATFSVGGAIVTDSDPIAEHEETMHKARALIAAIESIFRARASRQSRRTHEHDHEHEQRA